MKVIRNFFIILIICVVAIIGGRMTYHHHLESSSPVSAQQPSNNQWQHSSENRPYPNVNQYPRLWILVSKKKQRVYLINHGKVLYTMYASTVPQPERIIFKLNGDYRFLMPKVAKELAIGYLGKIMVNTFFILFLLIVKDNISLTKLIISVKRLTHMVVSVSPFRMLSGCIRILSKAPK